MQSRRLGAARMSRAVSCISASCRERPTATPWAARKVLAIAPPITSTSTLATRLPSSSSLVETLAPPTMAATGRIGLPSARVERREFRLHQAPGVGGQQVRHALGAGVRPVRGREGIVDVEIGQGRRVRRRRPGRWLPRPCGSGCSPAPECRRRAVLRRRRSRLRADAIVGEGDLRPSTSPSAVATGRSDIAGTTLALRPVEMAAHDDARALVGQFADGGQDSARCGCRSVMTPSRTGTLRSTRSRTRWLATASPSSVRTGTAYSRPNRAAVSDMRLEKPHSLSYQPITRASAPSTTAVCVASKLQEAGEWLKSMLTSFSVL